MTEHVPTEAPHDAALKAQGWLAVIVLSAIIVLIMLLMAFSTRNTPQSIDGERSTYSNHLQSDE